MFLIFIHSDLKYKSVNLSNDHEYFWSLVRLLFDDVLNKLCYLLKTKLQEKYSIAMVENQTSNKCVHPHIIIVIRYGDTMNFDCARLGGECLTVHSATNPGDIDDNPMFITVSFDGTWQKRDHMSMHGGGCHRHHDGAGGGL